MRLLLFFITVLFLSCSSNSTKRKIRGRWKSENGISIKINRSEFIIENDSPIPENYKLIGDSIIVKGFEASLFPQKYTDTLKIIRVTSDTLILKMSDHNFWILKK